MFITREQTCLFICLKTVGQRGSGTEEAVSSSLRLLWPLITGEGTQCPRECESPADNEPLHTLLRTLGALTRLKGHFP